MPTAPLEPFWLRKQEVTNYVKSVIQFLAFPRCVVTGVRRIMFMLYTAISVHVFLFNNVYHMVSGKISTLLVYPLSSVFARCIYFNFAAALCEQFLRKKKTHPPLGIAPDAWRGEAVWQFFVEVVLVYLHTNLP